MNAKMIGKVLIAIVIVSGAVLSLGAKFWAHDQYLSVAGPSFVKVTPDKRLAVVVGQEILFFNAAGSVTRRLPVRELGLETHGDVGFFANGDLLIYNGNRPLSLIERTARFLRLEPQDSGPPPESQGLQRCNLTSLECRPFAQGKLPELATAFHVAIDRASDTVYLADTARHQLYKITDDGEVLAKQGAGFEFPNQLLFENDKLFVVDTNNSAIKQIQTTTDGFGEELDSLTAKIEPDHCCPYAFTKVQQQCWVVIGDNALSNSQLMRYTAIGNQLGVVELRQEADPISITAFADSVWVADYDNFTLTRYSPAGELLGTIDDPQFLEMRDAALAQKQNYQRAESNYLILFIGVMVFGVIMAFLLEKEETLALFKFRLRKPEPVETEYEPLPAGETKWIDLARRGALMQKYFPLLMLAMGGLFAVSLVMMTAPFEAKALMAAMLPFFYFVYAITNAFSGKRLGVQGDQVITKDADGRIVTGNRHNLYFTRGQILIDKILIPLGQRHQSLFNYEQLDRWVFPRLERTGNKLNEWQMYKMMWHKGVPLLRYLLALLIYLAVLAAILYSFDLIET